MAIYLDGKNNMIKDIIISKGTIDRTVACPREIFAEALKCNALKVVILHNHPSGDSTPSKADILTTKRIYDSGELLGIELVDHIIIGDNSYFSLSENNLL